MPKYADPAVYPVGTPAATDNVMTRTAAGADGNFALGNLAGIAGLAAAADLSLYYNGTAWATYTVTSVGRTLLAATTQAAQRTALGAADDAAVVHLAGTETISGLKTFTGAQVRIQSNAPGFWIDESDNSFGLYFGLDGNILQFQVRPSGFTPSIVDIPMRMDFTNKWIGLVYGLRPMVDNSIDVGTGSLRIRTYYGVNSAINTSDARFKTEPRQLSEGERKAGSELARLPAIWEWLTGDRLHAGPTVQAAMAVMEAHGLDPFAYSFICYDEWEAEDATYDSDGNELTPARDAGNRYSFRKEELLCFMVSALAAENDLQAAKVAALDDRLAALEAKA
ncbi:tail fiber domain-containing protein [Stenotrophomonas geniculata]